MAGWSFPIIRKGRCWSGLVNALIHRDYSDMGSEVHIDIYDDRLEIYSPGGMPDGSVVQELDIDNVPSRAPQSRHRRTSSTA